MGCFTSVGQTSMQSQVGGGGVRFGRQGASKGSLYGPKGQPGNTRLGQSLQSETTQTETTQSEITQTRDYKQVQTNGSPSCFFIVVKGQEISGGIRSSTQSNDGPVDV